VPRRQFVIEVVDIHRKRLFIDKTENYVDYHGQDDADDDAGNDREIKRAAILLDCDVARQLAQKRNMRGEGKDQSQDNDYRT
jgi:hypothetical protein